MNTTYMNSLLEDLKGRVERATLRGSNISLFPETVGTLLAELERRDAENAALREEVESLRGIKVGDVVIVTEAITEDDESRVGKTGKVIEILEGHSIFAYVVNFGSKAVRMDKNQLKRIDAANPDAAPVEPPAREIAACTSSPQLTVYVV